jgi:biopolymer transport protein ExbB/TolQ
MHISAQLLRQLSELSTPAIFCAFIVHLVVFVMMWMAYGHNLRTIAQALEDFTRGLRHRSVLDRSVHLSDQIEAFVTDVKDALDTPSRAEDRQQLTVRMSILDEKRRYLHSLRFETFYNVWRTMIEAYPLAGMLGTILAIGAALQTGTETGNAITVNTIVSRFGEAIWSTFAGLVAAVVLIFLNSFIEPPFARLSENREHVRELIARAKRELSISATPTAH